MSTRKRKFLPRFLCQTEKIKQIFLCFFPRFPCRCTDYTDCTIRTDYTDLEICAQEKNIENRAQKSASKIVHAASKTIPYGLYGPAINAAVFSSISVPSLVLSFPLIFVLQNFSSCSRKIKNFSLLSLSSLFSLQSAKVRKMAFPCLFERTLRFI